MRSRRIFLGLGLFCVSLFFLVPPIVLAHAELKAAKPEPGETVESAPHSIDLTFTEAMQSGQIMLYSADNELIATSLQNEDTSETIIANIDQVLTEGEYTVFWQATSDDGHMINGSYNFAYQAPRTVSILDRPIFTAMSMLVFFLILGTGSWVIYRRRICSISTAESIDE